MNQDMDRLDSIIAGVKDITPKPPGTHHSRTPHPDESAVFRPEPPPAPRPKTPAPMPALPDSVRESVKQWDTDELDAWGDTINMHVYQDMPWRDVWGHARKNALGNAGRLGTDLVKFVAYNFVPKQFLFHDGLKKEAEDLHLAIGMLAVGLAYKGIQGFEKSDDASLSSMNQHLADTYGLQPNLNLFPGVDNPMYTGLLQHPKVRQLFAQPEMFIDAMVDMYKTNYGFGKHGEAGLKRYIAEEPLDFISDIAMVLTMGLSGVGAVMKASATGVRLSMRMSQLNKLQINKYIGKGRRVGQVYDRVADMYRKLPKALDNIGDDIWYIGTGVRGGNHPPGFWAKLAHYALTYADAGNLPFLVGGEVARFGKHLDILGVKAGSTKEASTQDIAELTKKLYKELYVKNKYYSRRNPARPDPYTGREVAGFMRAASPDGYKNPAVPNYDISESPELIRYIQFDDQTDAHVPCIILKPDTYFHQEEMLADQMQRIDHLSAAEFVQKADALLAQKSEYLVGPSGFGRTIIPLDDLNASELAQYSIQRTGDIDTLSLGRADRDAQAAFKEGGHLGDTSPFFVNYQSSDPDILIRYFDEELLGGESGVSTPFVLEDPDGAFRALEQDLEAKHQALQDHDADPVGGETEKSVMSDFYGALDAMSNFVEERIADGTAVDLRTLSDLDLQAYNVTRAYNPDMYGIWDAIPREHLPTPAKPNVDYDKFHSYMEVVRGIEEGLISEMAQTTDAYKLGNITFNSSRKIGDEIYRSFHNKYKGLGLEDAFSFPVFNNTTAVLIDELGSDFNKIKGSSKYTDRFGKFLQNKVRRYSRLFMGHKDEGFRGPGMDIDTQELVRADQMLRDELRNSQNLSEPDLAAYILEFVETQQERHALVHQNFTRTDHANSLHGIRQEMLETAMADNFVNDHRFHKLYNAITLDYYRNLQTSLRVNIFSPVHANIMTRGISKIQREMFEDAVQKYVSFSVTDINDPAVFSDKYRARFDDVLQRNLDARQAGKPFDTYAELQKTMWYGFLEYFEKQYAPNSQYSLTWASKHGGRAMLARMRKNIDSMQPEIDAIVADAAAAEESFRRSMTDVNNNFSEKFMGYMTEYGDDLQATRMGAAVLDNLVPVEELYQHVDDHTRARIRAAAAKELFRRGRDWSDVYFRFGVIDENLWKQTSWDVEIADLIETLKEAAEKYLDPSTPPDQHEMAYELLDMTLERLGTEGYFQGDTAIDEFIDFSVDADIDITHDIAQDIARVLHEKDYREVAGALQPPDSISHMEQTHDGVKIYRRGVYAVKHKGDADYVQDTVYYEPPRHPKHNYQMVDKIVMFVFRAEDTGGRGVPSPAMEYIVVPSELLGKYDPNKFLRRMRDPADHDPVWLPSTKLGYELDKIDAEKIFGKEGAARLQEVRTMLENLPKVKRGDPAGASAFLNDAITPNTQIFNAIVGSQIGELFNNGDAYLNHLDAAFSLLGDANVLELLDNASIMELLLRGAGDRQAQIKTWLVNYRRAAEQLLQTQAALQDPKENDKMSQKRITYRRAPGRSALDRLDGRIPVQ